MVAVATISSRGFRPVRPPPGFFRVPVRRGSSDSEASRHYLASVPPASLPALIAHRKRFGEPYNLLNEQKKQIEAALPRLEAELDILKVNSLSPRKSHSHPVICQSVGSSCQPKKNEEWLRESPTRG